MPNRASSIDGRQECASSAPDVYVTVDVEPDCPPYLWTWRGIEEGLPRLLDLLSKQNIPATFFTTGQTAETFPVPISSLPALGHELGCHGFSHLPFPTFDEVRARTEIRRTNGLLRSFAPVTSFRAPYLLMPERFMPILVDEGMRTDASRASYKLQGRPRPTPGLRRMSASVSSSILRLPSIIRDPWLRALKSPVVLFVHPWEFVDLTRTSLRLDCRFRTGDPALRALRSAIVLFRERGSRFRLIREFTG